MARSGATAMATAARIRLGSVWRRQDGRARRFRRDRANTARVEFLLQQLFWPGAIQLQLDGVFWKSHDCEPGNWLCQSFCGERSAVQVRSAACLQLLRESAAQCWLADRREYRVCR